MKTPEFKDAVAQEEKILREARNRLSELNSRAIKELCPVSLGDRLLANSGMYAGREMTAEFISIIAPLLNARNASWVFRISGPVKGCSDRSMTATAFIPFPED